MFCGMTDITLYENIWIFKQGLRNEIENICYMQQYFLTDENSFNVYYIFNFSHDKAKLYRCFIL